MAESISLEEKLLLGYIPYTLCGIALVFLLIILSGSAVAGLAGGPILLGWAAGLMICQLMIFILPAKPENISDFHAGCVVITFLNLFFSPLVIASLIWIVRGIASLAT